MSRGRSAWQRERRDRWDYECGWAAFWRRMPWAWLAFFALGVAVGSYLG